MTFIISKITYYNSDGAIKWDKLERKDSNDEERKIEIDTIKCDKVVVTEREKYYDSLYSGVRKKIYKMEIRGIERSGGEKNIFFVLIHDDVPHKQKIGVEREGQEKRWTLIILQKKISKLSDVKK